MKTTSVEQQIIHLLTEEYLTPKQIALRRQTSFQAVYKVIKRLKKKGLIRNQNLRLNKTVCTPIQPKPKDHKIRLHGQEFNIRILFKDHRYKAIREKNNILNIDGNTIRLFKNSIEVYSGQEFMAKTAHKAHSKSINYWNRFFHRLENDLQVILIKSRKMNIKIVKEHYAEINNELAKDCNDNKEKIKVRTTEDKKEWFSIDNSFNLNEAETYHPETAKPDMNNIVAPFFNDLRDNPDLPKLSEQYKLIDFLLKDRKYFAEHMVAHTDAIKKIAKLMEELNKRLNI